MLVRLRLILLTIRSLPVLFLIPVVISWIMVPLAAWGDYQAGNFAESARKLIAASQTLIPLISLLWPITYLQVFIEGDAKETLFSCRLRQPSLLPELMILTSGFCLLLLPSLFIIPSNLEISPYEVARLSLQILFFVGFLYLFTVAFNSVSMASMIVIAYLLFNILFASDIETGAYCMLRPHILLRNPIDLISRPTFFVLGTAAYAIGFLFESRYQQKY